MSPNRLNTEIVTSNRGLTHPLKAPGAVANGLTDITNVVVT